MIVCVFMKAKFHLFLSLYSLVTQTAFFSFVWGREKKGLVK